MRGERGCGEGRGCGKEVGSGGCGRGEVGSGGWVVGGEKVRWGEGREKKR